MNGTSPNQVNVDESGISSEDLETIEEIFGQDENFNPNVFELQTGRRIRTKKVSPFVIERILNSMEQPKTPTYSVTTVTGDEQEFELNEKMLEGEDFEARPEEQKAEWKKKWQEYKDADTTFRSELNEKLLNLIFYKVVDEAVPDDDEWIEDQEFIGIDVPRDNKRELKVHYIKTEVITSPSDIEGLLAHTMKSIGVRKEVLLQVEDSFRDRVQGEKVEGDTSRPGTKRRVIVKPGVDV